MVLLFTKKGEKTFLHGPGLLSAAKAEKAFKNGEQVSLIFANSPEEFTFPHCHLFSDSLA